MAFVVSALIGAYGAYQQRQAQKDASKQAKDQLNPLYQTQADLMKRLAPYAEGFYQRAQQAYDPAVAYYKALASGDRNRILAAVSPQLQAIGNKYRSITQASRELNPRSGAGAAFNADLAYRSADEQQALINQQQQSAYGNLSAMAGQAANIGGSASGQAIGAGAGAGNAAGSMYGAGMADANSQGQFYANIAKALMSTSSGQPGRW